MPKKRRKILSIVIIFCVVLLLGKFLSNPLNSVFHKVFSPVEKYFWDKGQKTDTFFFYLFQAKNIYNQNLFLKDQNTILARKNSELFNLAKENETLRQAFDLGEKEKFILFPAQVISKQATADVILIDKGLKDGLSEGMSVITSSGILIGNIKKANTNFSEISLITLKDFSFDITVGEAVALAKGDGDLGLSFDYAEKENPIPEKSLVFTSALGGNFPKGLLVGEIEKAQVNPAELFQTGKIKPYFKDYLRGNVFIIKN
ncbi:MAG: rod shape-determining protein MreC [bacterium]|nr:rod shape-determining protein MreC [bacterium]